MTEATGGEYYRTDSSADLTRLYEQIYVYETMDKTDNDKDGLCDIVETAGIRLINGQIIYTDPTLEDTDGDELLDGQEINPTPRKGYREVEIDGKKEIAKVYDFTWNSDPTNPDTDGDGIGDKDDNRPFEKGEYSVTAGDVVVGELTIVSSTYNGIGHSFLIYKSYIEDMLDLTEITGGYILVGNTGYIKSGPVIYNIKKEESISLGNTSKNLEDLFPHPISGEKSEDVAIMFNRELAIEIDSRYEAVQKYHNNAAYSIDITEEQLNTVIQTHNEINYYNLLNNNCTYVAHTAWNRAILRDAYGMDKQLADFAVYNTPRELKSLIAKWQGSYEINLRSILGLN